MDYCTVAQLKERVKTDLGDTTLQEIITEMSVLITQALGKEPASPMIEDFYNPGPVLWLTFKPDGSIIATDLSDGSIIDSDTYYIDGRAVIKKKTTLTALDDVEINDTRPNWPEGTRVQYAMADSPAVLALCRGVCIDLCRLVIDNSGGKQSESIGRYSYASKDIEKEQKKILSRLRYITGIRPVVAR